MKNRFYSIRSLTSLASFIPACFIYNSIVKLDSKVAFRETIENLRDLPQITQMKSKELKLFMIFGAPMLVGIIYVIKNGTFLPKIYFPIDNYLVSENVASNTNNEDNLNSCFGIIAFLKNKKPF